MLRNSVENYFYFFKTKKLLFKRYCKDIVTTNISFSVNIVYMIVNLKRSLHFFSFVKFVRSSLFRLFKNDNYILGATKKLWPQS